MRQLNYVFKVPNDYLGNIFLDDLHEYLNDNSYTLKLRGRNSIRKRLGFSRKKDVPVNSAEYYSVYIKAKMGSKYIPVGIDASGLLRKTSFIKRAGRWIKK